MYDDIFGPKRTWFSVYVYTLKRLRTVFGWVDRARREDAAGQAIERCLGTWVHYPSSVVPDDPDLTFRGACLYASRWATNRLARDINDMLGAQGMVPEAHDPLIEKAGDIIDRLQKDERDWHAWAKDFLDGRSSREAAAKAGVSHQTIMRRRKAGLDKIREEFT